MMGFGIEPAIQDGYRALAEHFIRKHPDMTTQHLLYHERTLEGCVTCAEGHHQYVIATGEEQVQ